MLFLLLLIITCKFKQLHFLKVKHHLKVTSVTFFRKFLIPNDLHVIWFLIMYMQFNQRHTIFQIVLNETAAHSVHSEGGFFLH